MDQTKSEVLELKMCFLKYMKESKYNEAHEIIQKILKIDPANPLISKCDKFFAQFKQKLIEKETEMQDDYDEEEDEDVQQQDEDDESDGVDPNDVPEVEDSSIHTWDEKLFQEQKKRFYEILPTIDSDDPKALVEALKLAKEQIQK